MHVSKNSLSIHLLVLANLYRVTNLYLALYSVLGGGGCPTDLVGLTEKTDT